MTLRTTAFSAIRWTSLAMLGRAAVAMLQIVVLSRLLGPADFKLVAIAVTVVSTGLVFTDMGISNALIRFRDVTTEELNSLFWLNVAIGALVSLCVALASPLIARFYGDGRLEALILIASSVFLITSFGQQQRALAEKTMRFRVLFWIEVLSATVGFATAIISALFNLGAVSIVIGNVVTATCITALSWAWLADGWRPQLIFSLARVRRFVSFGSSVVTVSIINALAFNADVFVGGRLLMGDALGFYFQPRDLCMRIMMVINPIVMRVSFPVFASIADDRERVRSVYVKAINMTASTNFPLYAFLAVLAPEVVHFALGPVWAPSAPILRLVAIWCAVRSIGNPVAYLLFALGRTRRVAVAAGAVAILVFLSVGIGAQFGVLGIPSTLIVLYAVLIPTFWLWLVEPACGASFIAYHGAILRPTLATSLSVLASMTALHWVEPTLARLFAGSIAGGLGYIVGSWIFNRGWLLSMIEFLLIDRAWARLTRSNNGLGRFMSLRGR